MKPALSRLARLAVVLLALGGAAAGQQQSFTLGGREDTPEERRLSFQLDATPGARRPGGCGWVSVEVYNPDSSAHEALVVLRQSSDPLSRTAVRLGPNERTRLVLPVPYTEWASRTEIAVDDGPVVRMNLTQLSQGNTTTLPSLLALTDDALLGSTLRTSVETGLPLMVDSGTLTGFVVKRVLDLPDRWQMLSGFDAVVLDVRSAALDAPRQQVLADYVASGERLILAGPVHALQGPLAALLATGAGPGSSGRHGFGKWLVSSADEQAFTEREIDWLSDPVLAGLGRAFSGLPEDGLGSHLQIPGVGEVPRSGFLVLIMVFVGAVGIAAFHQFKARRHGRLLVIVPATGLAFTGAMLAYGFFSEGLGIKGVVRSLTLLDQRTHEAVDVAQRTLYAGMQPGALPLQPGTLLASADLYRGSGNDRAHQLELDTSAGWVVGGSLLPARLPTQLTSVTVARPRERLRLRRAGPERLEVVPDSGLRPRAETGALIVRDFDGAWWVSAGEALRPMDLQETSARLAESLHGLRRLKPEDGPAWARRPAYRYAHSTRVDSEPPADPATQQRLHEWLAELVPEDPPPGTYLARVESDPCLDDLGLEVRWLEREHVVIGRLAEEDLLE